MKYALLTLAGIAGASSVQAQTAPTTPQPIVAPAIPQASPSPPITVSPTPVAPVARSARRLSPPSPAERRVRTANVQATREPAARAFVNAIQIYPYSDGVLYRLFAAPERVTDIALQPGEAIVSVAAGDTVRWTVGDTTSGGGEAKRVHILVKPFAAGLSTNLIITTDRRTYHLQLESTASTAMAALSWTYPQDELIAIRRAAEQERAAMPVAGGIAVDQLNFGYAITGDNPAWRPVRAFDDGRQTYIEFSPSIAVGEAPPLFVLGANGEAQLVNYRVAGRFYVVDRLFDAAELRLGQKKQAIVRIVRGNDRRQAKRRAS
ncbi:P-type conjugative transfer protein TrbG [Hankyongella ginsenosidimutans]|uniref:P-type conjugative transfer protein TrbG n=1 Tax=Hankyongella ginsenosidimutans TaxID=1763828 RepID=A0A4D7CBL9_9SPHN|nr:P-type conjugative transfer protein TrbG [Hankyongella ginsenosidimutans]QCI78792.1 P-type conjugative transfer protein TrbG [Hankyongella ginsenosidimutans]